MERSSYSRYQHQDREPYSIMKDNGLWILLTLAFVALVGLAQAQINVSTLGTYATGSYNTGAAEIADFDPLNDRIFFTNAQANSVVALNASNPAAPTLAFTLPMAAYGAGVNSVVVVPGGIAVAVEANPKTNPGVVVFFDLNGNFLSQVTVGALPDMVTVTPDGTKVLMANEGEPNDAYTIDPVGSVSIINISGGLATLTGANVTTLGFTAYTPAMLPGVRIFGPGASVAQDMEPESIAVSDDSQTAFVSCQENNAVVRINLATNSITQITALGYKDQSLAVNGLDASDSPTGINITNWPVRSLYLPDAIHAFTIAGQTYMVYANEGDQREYTGFNETLRIGNAAYSLDPTAFPNATTLKLSANLGRLNATRTLGDIGNDNDFDQIYVFGGRSFSIRDANGTLVYDSGDDLEQITAAANAANFNCNNSANGTFDTRSDDKGPEPEAATIGVINGKTYAFIGLERIGGIVVFDVSNPFAPVFVQYLNNRNFAGNAAAGTAGDLGVEGLTFVSATDSPNGVPLLISSNEISGTVSIFQVLGCTVGASCNDGNPATVNDVFNASCQCVGTAPTFAAGNVVVLQAGNGSGALANTGNPIVLREFTSTGTPGNTVNVPSTGTSAMVISGSATSEGNMSLSGDGTELIFTGYAQALPNATALAGSTSATINRAVGSVNGSGTFTREFTSSTFFSANNPRGAASDGTNFWGAGANQGVNYWGPGTAATIATGKTNLRSAAVFNGQLYVSSASTAGTPNVTGVFSVGSGLPTTTGQTLTTVAASGASTNGFYVSPSGTTIYVTNGTGGIQKFVNGTLAYTLTFADGANNVVADFSGASPVLYVVSNAGDKLLKITDPNSGSGSIAVTPQLLASAPANTAFRGIAFAPCTPAVWYADTDGDGFGDPNSTTSACSAPPGFVANSTDLCPSNGTKQAPGVCGCGAPDVSATYYADADSDGFGDPASPLAGFTCIVPAGFVSNNTDLCATDANKQAPGACGCGVADVVATYYADTDGDGFGAGAAIPGFTCISLGVTNNTDLCPTDANKQAPGSCGCGVADVVATYYADTDGDGFGAGAPIPGFTCIVPPGSVTNNTDNCPSVVGVIGSTCNDGNPNTTGDVLDANCACAGVPLTALTGCSSSQTPYVLPIGAGRTTTSILTVGDAIGGYQLVGIPDGMGAFDNNDGTFSLLVNHELGNTIGAVRAHGSIGAFVSKWVINKSNLCVQSGSDLISTVLLWNGTSFTPGTTAFARLCSADLPPATAFYNAGTGKGTQERIFMNGEETGAEGRAFGHIVTGPNTGTTYQLPRLGRFSWENSLACPTASDKTVVIGTDDATPGQVYVYIGTKQTTGNDIERAGLDNGNLYGVVVAGLTNEVSGSVIAPNTPFTLFNFGNVANTTGATLNTASNTASVTNFLRPEDGAWDPSNPNDFYFVTTNNFTSPSRMYLLRFTDILQPQLGGTITAVLDGAEAVGQKMMDNMCVDQLGQAFIQEDPGNQAYLARIHKYDIATDAITAVTTSDAARFVIGGANFLTQDEETSGIIDMKDILGKGRYLLNMQAHYAQPGALVEGGQLLELRTGDTTNVCVPPTIAAITAAQTICSLDTLKLNVAGNGTPGLSYSWSGTGAFLFANSNPSALVTGAATGNYVVTVTNACGSVNGTVNVTVNPAGTYYADTDGDGFGAGAPVVACTQPVGTVTNNTDNCPAVSGVIGTACDDGNPLTIGDVLNASCTCAGVLQTAFTGCSSSQDPYLNPLGAGNTTTSILTVGDLIGGYDMVGIPDGMGAYDNNNGTFTLLVNHELGATLGTTRAHGFAGSFVSKWIINKSDLCVQSGGDLITTLLTWNGSSFAPATAPIGRLCSGDLPPVSAFYNAGTGKGTTERIYMNGEEVGAEGRAFAHISTGTNAGTSYELPYLGKFSWENSLANPATGDKTVVVGTDDTTPGQVYVYIGTKQSTGTEIEKAGLQNGKLFGLKVNGLALETAANFPGVSTAFSLFDLGFVQNTTGAALQSASVANGVTEFLRPEDAHWDPSNPNTLYFVTTASFTGPSRLYKATFADILQPELGGTIVALLDGTEGQKMMDNMTVDQRGGIYIQEDPGNQAHIAKLWKYEIATDALTQVGYADSARFVTGAPLFLTQDEEHSGIIDMQDILGKGRYLFNVQAHYAIPGELVEGGQILEFATGDTTQACVPPAIASITPTTTVCSIDQLALNAAASGTLPLTYAWSGAGTFAFGNTNASAIVNGAATGSYTLTVTNACGTDNDAVAVTVNTAVTYYADVDGDGFGDPAVDSLACTQPAGYVPNNTDNCPAVVGVIGSTCDDGNASTGGDVINASCVCEGLPVDCEGVPAGPAQPGTACNDGNPNTVLDTYNASCSCVGIACTTNLVLAVETDGNGSQTTWEIRQQGTGILFQSGGGSYTNNAAVTDATCLPNGCYYLRVIDAGGDGIAGGGYILRTASGGRIIDNRDNFTNGSVSAIANNEGFCLPLGTDRLITSSCDKYDWVNNQYIVADANPAVSAQYGVTNGTSGYEIWFFNPNGGYSFRRFQSHNTANGLSASATRACHFRINNWSGNQLQANVLYNVKVRGRVAGVNSAWGVACRFILDPLRAQCPLTKLLDTPGNQFFSCGATRNWGNGNYVHANPVTGGNKYQFRFRIPAENFSVTRTVNSYFVQLNWGASPLQAGKTYQVDVRVSKNGGATWCTDFIAPALTDPWGDVCTLTIAGAAQGGGQNLVEAGIVENQEANLLMYPNPNRGDQLYLSLENITVGVNTVSVDIYDGFGKRVSARTVAVADGLINTVLELNGELAAGMYMVNITAGDQAYTQRLVIQP